MKVAVIGAGWMGAHISNVLNTKGYDVKIFESKKNTIHENETSDNYYVVKVISDSEVKFNNEKFNVANTILDDYCRKRY